MDHRPLLAEHIRTVSDNPKKAFSEARRFQPEVRKDWKEVNILKVRPSFLFLSNLGLGSDRHIDGTGFAAKIRTA